MKTITFTELLEAIDNAYCIDFDDNLTFPNVYKDDGILEIDTYEYLEFTETDIDSIECLPDNRIKLLTYNNFYIIKLLQSVSI
jgi:hypothetical protein